MEVVGNELLALNDLLSGCQDAQDDYDESRNQTQQITPHTLGEAAASNLPEVTRPIGQIHQEDPKAIWAMDEVPSDDEDDDTFDTRTRPKFEVLYKQSVMTEDVFLGLSDKDPSSAHCEAMVVRVECPNHRLEDIELDVKRNLFCIYLIQFVISKAKRNGTTSPRLSRSPYLSFETNGEISVNNCNCNCDVSQM
ncbi:hypothetical protein BBJ29_001567 [Phytophthora kernoviae]|uniref:PIH1D1/2/3 CS-like domain-containing protein n=1 Tax=Phytophthora kernoviae TaxID=325452 RepID=A0A3F2RVV6_9STRA|nr:hypothetical protein BBJ29_001567 [Phytophthora kernoviae]RLN65235.1 hypothetical protein BBP00_00002948 [Phytophthora kernoviae]